MSDKRGRELRRLLAAQGWAFDARLDGQGHYVARHPEAARPMRVPATPGEGRAWQNTLAQARRLVRQDPVE